MLDKLTQTLDFHSKALMLRAERQRNIASNIANADTPGYAARDFDFASALSDATAPRAQPGAGLPASIDDTPRGAWDSSAADGRTDARHIALKPVVFSGTGSDITAEGARAGYTVQTQPTLDGNSVDLDRERAAFVDNAVRYEATLRFINGQGKTLLAAIQGQ